MFTKLHMTNFKSWQDTGEVRLAPLTGFFGTNSSGKSSLLQMLLLLKQTTESNDRNLVLKTDGYVDLGSPSEITYDNTTDMMLSFDWTFPDVQGGTSLRELNVLRPNGWGSLRLTHLTFSTEIHADDTRTYVRSIRYAHDGNFRVDFVRAANNQYTMTIKVDGREPNRPQGRPRVYMKPQKSYGFSDEALRYYTNTQYLSDLVLLFEQQFRQVHYLGPLRDYPKRIYKYGGEQPMDVGLRGDDAINALIASKTQRLRPYPGRGRQGSVEERIAQWLVELELAHSFETRPLVKGHSEYEVRIRRHEQSPEVVITDLGIGVSQILPVLVLCYYVPSGSTIIFEQPELHLHPSVQSGLADVFIDVIQKRNVQIILESHSEHLLRRLQRRIAEGKVTPNETAFYFCDLQNGASKIQSLEIDDFGQIRNWPADFFGDVAGDMAATLDAGFERQLNK